MSGDTIDPERHGTDYEYVLTVRRSVLAWVVLWRGFGWQYSSFRDDLDRAGKDAGRRELCWVFKGIFER